jgi:MinD-like ATPase involved in chromosome partitioning or flagellar assembly
MPYQLAQADPLAVPDPPADTATPAVESVWTLQTPASPPDTNVIPLSARAANPTPSSPHTDAPQPAQPAAGDDTTEWPTFLTQRQAEPPASQGWRGTLNRIGLHLKPSADERAERADIHSVSQHWPGPRTVAFVNGKGGASKTPCAILASAVFARHGGAGVLTWDNNQTRGTLTWRTEQGAHDATILDLLPQVPRLLGTDAQSADLAHYVHHQTDDRYDVLRSKPTLLAAAQRLSPTDVDQIHAVAAKYYRLIMIDSGNDESDPMWLRMIDHTDQLVVATNTRDDYAEGGAWALKGLRERGDQHSHNLATNAVVIISQADPKATTADVQRITDGFTPITRAVAHIPYDPAIIGGPLHYQALRPDTKRAWLHAAALIAQGL